MYKPIKLILNTLSFIIVLIINYLSNTDIIGEMSVGAVSNMYPTVITPAGYAFSVWGLIYFFLILFVGYQWYSSIKKKGELLNKVGLYFTLSNLANTFWIIAWVNNLIFLSLVLISLLLFCLFRLVQNLNLERFSSSLTTKLFVWWPIAIYSGWIILATALNFNVFLVRYGYDNVLWNATIWGVILLILGTLIYTYLIYSRNLRESAVIGIWGFTAIVINQIKENPVTGILALICAIFLFINVVYHAYRNKSFLIKKF